MKPQTVTTSIKYWVELEVNKEAMTEETYHDGHRNVNRECSESLLPQDGRWYRRRRVVVVMVRNVDWYSRMVGRIIYCQNATSSSP